MKYVGYRFASEKKIPGFQIGNAWRFSKKEIDSWIEKESKTKDK
jgi:excisionase family DNA binding protein